MDYRFNTEDDLIKLFMSLKNILVNYGTLKNGFLKYYSCKRNSIEEALIKFMGNLRNGNNNFLIPEKF